MLFYLALLLLNKLSWKLFESLQPGNMLNVYVVKDPKQKTMHVFCAAAMFLVFLALNAKWFFRQARRFQRYERCDTAPPVIGEIPAAIPASSGVPESVK
jgi:hypothetical protein